MWLFRDRSISTTDLDNDYLSMEALRTFSRICHGLFCGSLLMVPMTIILLAKPSEIASSGVVAVFGGLLVTALSMLGLELDGIMLGLCAQVAVLATFIANLRQGSA